jgi:glycosyltransferase involved in cell wall biosynthesis
MTPPCAPSTGAKHALFVTPEAPVAGQGGGGLRSASLLAYLKAHYQVDMVRFALEPHSKAPAGRAWRNAVRLLRGRPPLFDRYSGHDKQVALAMRQERYDVAVVEHFWCASYADLLRPRCARLVLDLHNIESRLARTHAAAARWPGSWASGRFARFYERLEREWLPRFDTVLVASPEDRARIVHPDVRIFPNALPAIEQPSAPERDVIMFSGNLEYHPNVEAVRWFRAAIWPRVHERFPALRWELAGRNPEAVAALVAGDPSIVLTGPMEDAIAALAPARVCVVPLLSGSGTRFKILEAWAAGRAVVSTSLGAEGLPARDGEHLLLADTAQAFAGAIARLIEDELLRRKLGMAGRALYLERFTWPAAWRMLDDAGGL